MTLDIRKGDTLVDANSDEYAIHTFEWWKGDLNSTAAFQKMATETYSVDRAPAIVSGKRGKPTENISSVSGTPLDPVSPENRTKITIRAPHDLLEVFLADSDGYCRCLVSRNVKNA